MTVKIKFTVLYLVWTLSAYPAYANAIDSVKTNADVIKFLAANLGKEYENYYYPFYEKTELSEKDSFFAQHEKKAYQSNSFYKADIDGKTDLIIDGSSSFIVMYLGNKYVMHPIERGALPHHFFKEAIRLPDQSTALLFRHDRTVGSYSNAKTVSKIDTIVYKFGEFVEYNENPTSVNVNRIDFWKRAACFGDCTDFNMEVNKNGQCEYNVIESQEFRDSVGKYICTLNSGQVNALLNLVNYLDINSLKSEYNNRVSDQPTGTITFYFNDGSEKTIEDIGLQGTVGLISVYSEIFELRKSIKWRKS